MIDLFFATGDQEAGHLVLAAFRRSVSQTQVRWQTPALYGSASSNLVVAINPSQALGLELLSRLKSGYCKLLVLGHLPACLVDYWGLVPLDWPQNLPDASRSPPAPSYGYAESPAVVRYRALASTLHAENWSRPFERFDFTDEWNNLGYGAIRADHSVWAVAQPLRADASHEIAGIEVAGAASASYCALFDEPAASAIWINRQVGTIDSYEWRMLEYFFASYRADDLPCQPVLQEIPWGHDAAITMRLDCDEDVESARPLWQAYRAMQVPFSLAIHTTNLADSKHDTILQDMVAAGESLLSHTATHAPNWGGSYEAAFQEGVESARRIHQACGQTVRYAVSPFHQTPQYALQGLADAGYLGVVGGIIRNDPGFLMARGGELAHLPQGFVGHSQQYMLHGDCMLTGNDPLAVYKAAFDRALETKTLFGYLDHPFSERYQYGWPNEPLRVARHREFVGHMRSRAKSPVFLSQTEALDFLRHKMGWQVNPAQGGYSLCGPVAQYSALSVGVEYRGMCIRAENGAEL